MDRSGFGIFDSIFLSLPYYLKIVLHGACLHVGLQTETLSTLAGEIALLMNIIFTKDFADQIELSDFQLRVAELVH
jgi:hypothetical protein